MKKVAIYMKSLSSSQRKCFMVQLKLDRSIVAEVLAQNREASYFELEYLYCERGGDPIRFRTCIERASQELSLDYPSPLYEE